MRRIIAAIAGIFLFSLSANAQVRDPGVPIVGVTVDDVSNTAGIVDSLSRMARFPTTRVVFDPGVSPGSYAGPISQIRPVSFVMGQLVDSSAMRRISLDTARTRTTRYLDRLKSSVDIWEVGNELNGSWLGTNVMAKVQIMYDLVEARGGKTALTFFYEGEPSDPGNCIDTGGGGNDMFTWIGKQFSLTVPAEQRPAAREAMRLGVDYALVSWFPDQCRQAKPDWPTVYARLAQIFPNSKVGFGELGTARPRGGSAFEINLIKTYYPMACTAIMPPSYIGGYFWWYFAEEMVPHTKPLFGVLNTAIGQCPS